MAIIAKALHAKSVALESSKLGWGLSELSP